MEEINHFPAGDVRAVLNMYGFGASFTEQREYICEDDGNGWIRVVLSVLTGNGERLVVKTVRDGDDVDAAREKIERQSAFSECMRRNGIRTPKRYSVGGKFCHSYTYNGFMCNVTVEDWCGEEVRAIDAGLAFKIGALMARMHLLSLENHCEIGCGTLFSAAYWNDVDVYEDFCGICDDPRLDSSVVAEIKRLRSEKLQALRALWDRLPKAAVQGDISINNLVLENGELTVFDYNNAGDEVLVSDLVMEGLLTAYEMELPEGADPSSREKLFPALLRGYLSVRQLTSDEAGAAWLIYTLYNSLWFSRVVFREDSLQKAVQRGDFTVANRLLVRMLADMVEEDDGRFRES